MAGEPPLRVLLIDNFDSYTFNLYQRLASVALVGPQQKGTPAGRVAVTVDVVRNTAVLTPDGGPVGPGGEAAALEQLRSRYDCVVVSPGPGLPSREADFGGCGEVIRDSARADGRGLPLLGVCLGHQGIVEAFGGLVVHAPDIAHGVRSSMTHDGSDPLFRDVPTRFQAVRYHSWLGELPSPPDAGCPLKSIAATVDGELPMAVRHTGRPIWGVQFHPESVCTEHGDTILHNFLSEALALRRSATAMVDGDATGVKETPTILPPPRMPSASSSVQLLFDYVTAPPLPEGGGARDIGASLYDALVQNRPFCFWLDSSKMASKGVPGGQYSFLGWVGVDDAAAGAHNSPRSKAVQYYSETRAFRSMRLAPGDGASVISSEEALPAEYPSFFDWLQSELDARSLSSAARDTLQCRRIGENGTESCDFPFPFVGGFVGYLGYEMRRECGSDCNVSSRQPDASFIYTERFIAIDHCSRRVYAAAVCDEAAGSEASSCAWVRQTLIDATAALNAPNVLSTKNDVRSTKDETQADCGLHSDFTLRHDFHGYTRNIRDCLKEIECGESYELCLTNEMTATIPDTAAPPPVLYDTMRQLNPAPYGALLRFENLWVLQGSPECFVRISRQGVVQAKPIKGTRPRGATKEEDEQLRLDLATSPKDFSENLMILDLMRNDIGQVCEVGSVTAPRIMQVESFATVHQLVSTVAGQLRHDLGAADLLHHTFPPGSMTGAPKLRSMSILERLERGPRGVYSGTLGYLSLDGGCDMSVVIRTVVLDTAARRWSIGCGGAIVHRSEPAVEFHEMLLKAKAPLRASAAAFFGQGMLAPTAEIPVIGIDGSMGDATTIRGLKSMAAGVRDTQTDGGSRRKSSIQGEVYAKFGELAHSRDTSEVDALIPEGPSVEVIGSAEAVSIAGKATSEQLLGGLGVRGISLGLDRIRGVLGHLNNPQEHVGGVVHVTGTNGKGSVCSFVVAALRGACGACNKSVGLFSSPHLVRFTECIKVDGVDISDADLAREVNVTLQACQDCKTELTQFEVLTVAAFLYFRRCGVCVTVLEVGLGGRLDSTNVVSAENTLCSVVTSISLDHTNILGNTVQEIAKEKSGIFRAGRPVICGSTIPPDAHAVIVAAAMALECPITTAGTASRDADDRVCSYGAFQGVRFSLAGDHQLSNFAIAAEVLLTPNVSRIVGFKDPTEAFVRGICTLVRWPARMQPLIFCNRLILLDGSHNEEAGRVLSSFVATEAIRLGHECETGVQVNWIVGMLSGKNAAGYLKTLLNASRGDTLTCVPVRPNVSWHSGKPPEDLAAEAASLDLLPPDRIHVGRNVEEAVQLSSALDVHHGITVVCGSLHLCGQVLAFCEHNITNEEPLQLLETLRYVKESDEVLFLDSHIARMRSAALRFGYPFSEKHFRDLVGRAVIECTTDIRLRCVLSPNGVLEGASTSLPNSPRPICVLPSIDVNHSNKVSVSVLQTNIDPLNALVNFKTTWRHVYNDAMKRRPCAESTSDVILVNSRGEITEATIYNVAVYCADRTRWITPPTSCGLLPGLARDHLLKAGSLSEGVLTVDTLRRAKAVCVMNSVRGVLPAQIIWGQLTE